MCGGINHSSTTSYLVATSIRVPRHIDLIFEKSKQQLNHIRCMTARYELLYYTVHLSMSCTHPCSSANYTLRFFLLPQLALCTACLYCTTVLHRPCLYCTSSLLSVASLFPRYVLWISIFIYCVYAIDPWRDFCDAQIRKVVRSVLTFDDRGDSQEWRDCATAYVDVSSIYYIANWWGMTLLLLNPYIACCLMMITSSRFSARGTLLL